MLFGNRLAKASGKKTAEDPAAVKRLHRQQIQKSQNQRKRANLPEKRIACKRKNQCRAKKAGRRAGRGKKPLLLVGLHARNPDARAEQAEVEKAQREAEREEQRKQLQAIQEELRKAREESARQKESESDANDTSE